MSTGTVRACERSIGGSDAAGGDGDDVPPPPVEKAESIQTLQPVYFNLWRKDPSAHSSQVAVSVHDLYAPSTGPITPTLPHSR